jgi:hypothetical protein
MQPSARHTTNRSSRFTVIVVGPTWIGRVKPWAS